METQRPEIQYPQNFDIKLLVSAEHPIEETKKSIGDILTKCKVVYSFSNVTSSAKGNYLSYSFNVDIEDSEQMKKIYEMLKDVPGVKFIL